MQGFHGIGGVRGLGAIDPATITALVQSGLSLTSSSVDLAVAVEQRKAAEAAAKKKKKHAAPTAPAMTVPPVAPAAQAETSVAPYLLGGVLIVGVAFLVRRSSNKQNAARSRG